MNNKYLLTYQDDIRNFGTFAWFDYESQMDDYINQNENIHVLERLHIIQAEEV